MTHVRKRSVRRIRILDSVERFFSWCDISKNGNSINLITGLDNRQKREEIIPFNGNDISDREILIGRKLARENFVLCDEIANNFRMSLNAVSVRGFPRDLQFQVGFYAVIFYFASWYRFFMRCCRKASFIHEVRAHSIINCCISEKITSSYFSVRRSVNFKKAKN